MVRKVYPLLYDHDITSGFIPGDLDLQGWGGHEEYFKQRILETKPELIIEVGSWKGKSACKMADLCSSNSFDVEIVCIDTWLGSQEMWENHNDKKRYGSLDLKNGYPQLYYQFLSNVVLTGNSDRITPFPQTSVNAARLLKKNDIQADLIYIDASHEYEDVVLDLDAYWDLLKPGGVMFGDDYCEYWSGVIKAVDEFSYDYDLLVEHERFENPDGQAPSDYWKLVKPSYGTNVS